MRARPTITLGWPSERPSGRRPRFNTRDALRSSTTLILLVSSFFWYMSFRYCAASYVRDPTSYFFDETKAYQRLYSLQREHEALELLRAANRSGVSESRQSDSPSMCVGVATISRPSKDQYVKGTIGSLLEGLTETQRREIFLMPFIAHTDPSVHPIYREPWLKAVSDKILEYEVDEDEMARLRMLEEDHHPRNKSMFDYGYLLSHCLQTGARFVAVIEDDVIAKAGWYTDAMLALQEIQSQVGETGWLYLRMFYTEGLLGWNSEEWPRYLGWSLIALVILLSGLMGARTCSPRLQRHLSNVNIAILCFVCLPGFIGLYFMAGRVSMQPPHPGVRKMSRFGCCSQGFIFPRQIVSRTIERTKRAMFEDYYIDMLLERWADAEDLARFAIFPSLLQHVGIKSSKGWGYDEHAGTTWNFQFETLSP